MLDLLLDLIAGWFGAKLPRGCVIAIVIAFILLMGFLLWLTA